MSNRSHAELVHALWRSNGKALNLAGSDAALQEHLHCIDTLARRCLRVANLTRQAASVA